MLKLACASTHLFNSPEYKFVNTITIKSRSPEKEKYLVKFNDDDGLKWGTRWHWLLKEDVEPYVM